MARRTTCASIAAGLSGEPLRLVEQANTFDADDFRGFGPFAPPHVHLGMIEAGRLDLGNDGAWLGLRFRNVRVNETVEAVEPLGRWRA